MQDIMLFEMQYHLLQALEKGLKALLYGRVLGCDKLATHDICQLAALTGDSFLCDKAYQVQAIVGTAPRTRYPDVLPPPAVPRDVYTLNDAVTVHQLTQSALKLIRHRIQA